MIKKNLRSLLFLFLLVTGTIFANPYEQDQNTAFLFNFDENFPADKGQVARYTHNGIYGSALRLDKKHSFAIPTDPNQDLSQGFTIEAWVRLARVERTNFATFIELPGLFSWKINIYPDGTAKIDLTLNTSEKTGRLKTKQFLPCGTWVHLACRYNPRENDGKRLALLVNGTDSDKLTGYQNRAPSQGKLVNKKKSWGFGGQLTAEVDELRLSTIARSDQELHGVWPSGIVKEYWLDTQPWKPVPPPQSQTRQTWVTQTLAVPTFEAIGIRLRFNKREKLPKLSTAKLRYRLSGQDIWQDGLDLFPVPDRAELRGSILALKPATSYEIEVTPILEKVKLPSLHLEATTWNETPKIAEVRELPESGGPLFISAQGSEDGWILYKPADGKESQIEGGEKTTAAIRFQNAAYVILERAVVQGGRVHGISVVDSSNIRIRNCDISGWGEIGDFSKDGVGRAPDGHRINYNAGIYLGPGSRQIVAEHNFMHHQRSTANSWEFGHPVGPQGMVISNTKGNHVIRYNDMIGSEEHWWNDALEGRPNGRISGGPHQDTDIYGNTMFFANDDGTELDGGQINIRFHHNWIENTLCGVSCAPCISGPSYVYRNLFSNLGDERVRRGSAFKMGGGPKYSPGLNVIFHNSVYGKAGGLRSVGFGENNPKVHRGGYHAFSRNNLFAGPSDTAQDVTDYSTVPVSSFDYDLLGRGGAKVAPGNETHALRAKPLFVDEKNGDYRLRENSPGVDAAIHIPGMNDQFSGNAPDMGALESNAPIAFPPRPHGIFATPPRLAKRLLLDKPDTHQATLALTVPRQAGTSWTAIASSDWIQCSPATADCSGTAQTIHVRFNLGDTNKAHRRGAVTFRTNLGYLRTIPIDLAVAYDPIEILIEAETGTLTGEMIAGTDAEDPTRKFIHTKIPEKALTGSARIESQGSAIFTINIPKTGIYHLSGKAYAPEPKGMHDSFFVKIDNEEKTRWDVNVGNRWRWSLANKSWKLEAGQHTITVLSRERGTRLDQLLLSNNRHAGPIPR